MPETYRIRYEKVHKQLLQEIKARQRVESLLRTIAEGISGSTGKEFFLSLVRYLARALDMDYALVGKLVGESKTSIQTVAACFGGNIINNFQYELVDTPCERAVRQGKCLYPKNVQGLFPEIPFSVGADKIESYFGIRLNDTEGSALGLLALMKTSAIDPSWIDTSILQVFAIRAAAELERQSQEQELIKARNLEALGRMAAGVAHEINNPLANASLSIQLVKKKLAPHRTDPTVMKKLESVERNIDKASDIARELLLFSRQRNLALKPINLKDIIIQACSALTYDLKNVKIGCDLPKLPNISGDPLRFEGLFLNILNTAIEAMPDGGDIEILSIQSGETLTIKISDTGSGIPDEILPHVLDPFYTTKEVGKGTGLGLAICYGTIKQSNGSMEISSIVGKGTTVTISLPIARTSDF